MVLLGLVVAFQSGVLSDARLAKTTDFDRSLQQITDFCSDVSNTSGVQFSVSKNVQDLKVDVFVDKRPLAETLDKIAKALNCDWVPVEKGYRLEMDVKNVNRERNFNQAEDDEDLRLLKLTLWGRQYVATFFPPTNVKRMMGESFFSFKLRKEIVDPFQKEYMEAEQAKDTTRMKTAMEKWSAVESSLNDFMIGRILNQFDKAAMDRFWKGEPFAASTDPAAKYKVYPSDFPLLGTSSYSSGDGKTHEADYQHFSFFRFDPIANKIRMNMLTYAIMPPPYNQQGASKGGGGFAFSSTSNPISEGLKAMPFYTDLIPWMDHEAMSKKFPQMINKETKEWKSPYFNQRRRLGDHLRWFHKATNIPVVAQADRSCTWSWINLNRGFDSASQYVEAMMNDNEMLAKEDNGFLVARNFRYWRHRRHEAPESLWAQFESRRNATPLAFQDYVKVAQSFREDQLYSQEIGYPLSQIDNLTALAGYDSLRLFGSLPSDQQKNAIEKGIYISDLGSAQQSQMIDTVTKLILDTGILSIDFAKVLVAKGLAPNQFNNLRFKVQVTEFPEGDHYSDELKDGDVIIEKRGTKRYAASHYSFNYSISSNETVSQGIQFRK